jgi:hypothetical protein
MEELKQERSAKFIYRRRFMMALPVMIIPFALGAFAVLGGGKGRKDNHPVPSSGNGFNMELPGAHFDKKETEKDKLGYYTKADADSLKHQQQLRQDSNFPIPVVANSFKIPAGGWHPEARRSLPGRQEIGTGLDPKADELLKKLAELKNSLQHPTVPPQGLLNSPAESGKLIVGPQSPDLGRMEKLLAGLHSRDSGDGDPKIDRINSMLDKIMRIQHPGEGKPSDTAGRGEAKKNPGEFIGKRDSSEIRDLADGGSRDGQAQAEDGFYMIDDEGGEDSARANLIAAIVPESQMVVAGSTLMLRLTEDATINGIVIPKGNPLSGKVFWQNDRLMVNISSVRCKNSEYLVAMRAYDMDGLEGLNVPGSATREVAKESADQGIGALGITSFNASLEAQTATAGIQAAKTLLSRKVKLVRGYVPAGYQVFLQNTKISLR